MAQGILNTNDNFPGDSFGNATAAVVNAHAQGNMVPNIGDTVISDQGNAFTITGFIYNINQNSQIVIVVK